MIFLSIVIPHYNLPRELLTRCVKSIIEQEITPDSYEIIIVDDGSAEPPRWLGETFADYPVYLHEISHAGPGAARNRGIAEARGRYIQFIDADDCLQPKSLAPCLEIIREELPQIFRFHYRICTNESRLSESTTPTTIKTSNTISGALYMAENNLSGSPCTYIFERNVALKHNIEFAANVFHEDEEFNVKLHYHATSLIDSNAVIYNYCLRSGSTTSSSDNEFEEKRLDDLFSLLERLTLFVKKQEETSKKIQRRAMKRKMSMLTVDTILNLLYSNKSAKQIHTLCKERLQPLSLYPLPHLNHSIKYTLFRLLTNSKIGFTILRLITPREKPAKR